MAGFDQNGSAAGRLSGGRLLLVTGLLLTLIITISLGIAVVMIYQSDMILPGVQVSTIPLGGRSISDASVDLEQNWQSPIIQLGEGDRVMAVSASSLGIVLDAEATAQRAHQEGRSLSWLDGVYNGDWNLEIAPVWKFDPAAAEAFLLGSADDLSLPTVNAGIRMVNGQVVATPPVSGQQLDVVATVARMEYDLDRIVAEGRFLPVTFPVPAEVIDVSAALGEAQELLANTLTIHLHDSITGETMVWAVEPAEWSQWAYLGVTRESPPALLWDLDRIEVEAFLLAQAAALEPDRNIDVELAVPAVIQAAFEGVWQLDLDLIRRPE
jgi:hypothetical protein